jgi:hypothetical protein
MTGENAGGGRERPGQGTLPLEAEVSVLTEPRREDGEGPGPCPFCGSTSRCCEHLPVTADRTLALFRGPEYHRLVRPAEARLQRALRTFLVRLGRMPAPWRRKLVSDVEPPRLRHALSAVLSAWPTPPGDEVDTVLEGDARWEYLEEILFRCRDTVGLPWAFGGVPGLPSDGIDFWSRDPARAARDAARLVFEDAAVVDRLLLLP